jgi:hypothetical protein
LASIAPVPTDGMRPCTALKPCRPPGKCAGLLLEQPMPDSLMTLRVDAHLVNASMMRSEIALWPQPAQASSCAFVDLRFETDSIDFQWCSHIWNL